MEKKGQAAMEFLMTYGWAILVAIIAIGVLAYYGVFSPGKFVSSAATVNAPFGISGNDYNILSTATDASNDGTVNLNMIQNSGDTISNATIIINGTGTMAGVGCMNSTVIDWNSGVSKTIVIECTDGASTDPMTTGGSFGGNIAITYIKQGSTLPQQASGTIRGSIQ